MLKHRKYPVQFVLLASVLGFAALAHGGAQQDAQSQGGTGAQKGTGRDQAAAPATRASSLPRGKKLVLKDGTFQLVGDYKIEDDRVRFYSLDRSDWEEMPVALVDWDKTKEADAAQAKTDAALLTRVHAQEEARIVQPLDIDASLEAAPGVFLPPGEGVFAFDGKAVLSVAPAEPTFKTNKKREVEKVLSPIPIVPSRHSVSIQGGHSKLRVQTGQPEFYMRTKQEGDPEMQLVPAKAKGDTRQIANVDELFRMQNAATKPLLMQRWEIAKGVYRFTLGQTLPAGEYALIEVIPGKTEMEQLSIYVWDFGVDPPGTAGHKTN